MFFTAEDAEEGNSLKTSQKTQTNDVTRLWLFVALTQNPFAPSAFFAPLRLEKGLVWSAAV